MATDLTLGDEVCIKSGSKPGLTFVITEFQELGNDWLACGVYGCMPVDLLRKVDSHAATASSEKRRNRNVPDGDYEQIRDE